MDIVKLSIERPVGLVVCVLLVVMFGLISLLAIPIQLTPTVDRPLITVTTNWPGRSPEEIVDEITEEQEKRLKNTSNLKSMRSLSREGSVEITLEFYIGTEMARALQEVADALRQVPSYPEDVDEPTVKAADGAADNAIAWIICDVDPAHEAELADFDISTLQDAMDRDVKPFLERVDGVAEVNVFGGREREVRIQLDPTALAQRGITYRDVLLALRAENQNISSGTIDEGKRDIRVRVLGRFRKPADVEETILAYRDGKPVFVRDVGTVEIAHQKVRGFVRAFGKPVLAMNAIRQTNANVVNVMRDLRARLDEVRKDLLPALHPKAGPHLRLRQVYDETVYIDSAVALVTDNLYIGGGLAALVLLVFLRAVRPTVVISLAIPLSVIGTFLVMIALGRTLNVISLAGLSFAVGMVVDNAIVVLENIDRRLKEGDDLLTACYLGGKEVWGAILASTLTTVAVFIPVLLIEEEAGQLFQDISIAIVASVSLSLIVSITVVPSACARWLKAPKRAAQAEPVDPRSRIGLLGKLIIVLSRGVLGLTVRPALIIGLSVASVLGSLWLMPPLDYLPAGNRNLVFGGLLIPPGYAVEQQAKLAQRIESVVMPYARADIRRPETVAALPKVFRYDAPTSPFEPVPVENFFIGAFRGGMFVGATSQDPEVVIPVGSLLTNAMNTIPDAFGGARQSTIFGRGVGSGSSVDIEISGPKLQRVIDAAGAMFAMAAPRYGYGNVRPDPANFNLSQPEWTLRLNELGRELGLRTQDLGTTSRALFDGALAGEMDLEGEAVDLVIVPSGGRLAAKESLPSIPIATPRGPVVPIDRVASVVPGLAPQEIQRIEELASVTIRVVPPEGKAIGEVTEEIRRDVVAPVVALGLIDASMRVRLEGSAAKLDEVQAALFGKPFERIPEVLATAQTYAPKVFVAGLALGALGLLFGLIRALGSRRLDFLYGGFYVFFAAAVIVGLGTGIVLFPHLLLARIIWALLVTYLLMAALFESFFHPLIIMFTVPLAVVGGFGGLRLVHDASIRNPTIAPQQLDILTMLGFVILIGVVVNNAILIVHQALNFMRGEDDGGKPVEPLPLLEAVAASTSTRVRPILMSTLTSLLGMLPLVLFPGAGSEMYRGLGSVVLGGLLISTIFTLILVPLLFGLVAEMRAGVTVLFGGKGEDAQG